MSPTKPGLHHTGTPNLYLQVSVNKNTGKIRRSWIYRYKSVMGTTRSMGLGSFKAISLKTAKELAEQQAKIRLFPREDHEFIQDPILNRKRARRLAKEQFTQSMKLSLKQVTEEFLEANGKNWSDSYIQKWKRMFEQHLYDGVSKTPSSDITKDQVIAALKPVFKNTPRQAKILQEHLQVVFDWCIHKGYCQTNPAKWEGNLEFEFKNHVRISVQHMASLKYQDAPTFFKALQTKKTTVSAALQLILLTAVRSGEATNARWDEFDLENKVWTIPANRMKMKKEHKVPLSDAVMVVLSGLYLSPVQPDPAYRQVVFPGRKPNQPVSDTSLRLLKNTLGYKNITIHGLRATFRTWANEQTSYPHEVKEASLAHQIPSAVERAYVRDTLFDKRKDLLREWAQYLQ
jgi:integrase